MSGLVRSISALFCLVWSCSVLFCLWFFQALSRWVLFKLVHTCSHSFNIIWYYLVSFGVIWSRSVSSCFCHIKSPFRKFWSNFFRPILIGNCSDLHIHAISTTTTTTTTTTNNNNNNNNKKKKTSIYRPQQIN